MRLPQQQKSPQIERGAGADAVAENGNGNGTARWQLWASVASVALILLGAMMTLYVEVNTAYATANELKERVERMSVALSDQQSKLNTVCADLIEVETQFKASDQVRNLIHVNDLRNYSVLYKKVMKEDYPVGEPYLPTIAQEQPAPCK